MLHDFEEYTDGVLTIKRTYRCVGCGLNVKIGSASAFVGSRESSLRDYLKQNRIPTTCEDYLVQTVLNT